MPDVVLKLKASFLLAARQREMAALGLAESGVFSLGVDLTKDRGVESRIGSRAVLARPEPGDLHGFDHRLAVHRLFRIAKHDDRRFDLADPLGVRR